MYNEKVKQNIYKYLQKRKDDPILKEQKIKWSRDCFNRMKAENGERYEKKKQAGRIRYWLNIYKENEDKENILDRLKKKDIELFDKLTILINT